MIIPRRPPVSYLTSPKRPKLTLVSPRRQLTVHVSASKTLFGAGVQVLLRVLPLIPVIHVLRGRVRSARTIVRHVGAQRCVCTAPLVLSTDALLHIRRADR